MTHGLRGLGRVGALALGLSMVGCGLLLDSPGGVTGPSSVVTGSGVLATESRSVGGFSSVSISGASRLILEQAGSESVTVTAEDNLLSLLTAEVVGSRLVLGLRPGVSVSPTREIVYRVTGRGLCDVMLSGAAHAEAFGLDCPTFLVDLSGAASIVASGKTESQTVRASGASLYRTADLRSLSANLDLSGACLGTVRVSDRLVVNASGASTLEYFGSPVISATTTGGSLVRRIGD